MTLIRKENFASFDVMIDLRSLRSEMFHSLLPKHFKVSFCLVERVFYCPWVLSDPVCISRKYC